MLRNFHLYFYKHTYLHKHLHLFQKTFNYNFFNYKKKLLHIYNLIKSFLFTYISFLSLLYFSFIKLYFPKLLKYLILEKSLQIQVLL